MDNSNVSNNELAAHDADRFARLESLVEGIASVVDTLRPAASVIPGGAVAAGIVSAVAHGADAVIDSLQGETVDAAALAAGMISSSTGDAKLDARLANIEAFIAASLPLLQFLGKQFGMAAPASVAPAPMNVEDA